MSARVKSHLESRVTFILALLSFVLLYPLFFIALIDNAEAFIYLMMTGFFDNLLGRRMR